MSNPDTQNQATPGDSPRYFRLLEKGERFIEGDFWISDHNIKRKTEPGMQIACDTLYFRPVVQVDEWISYTDRKPTKEDFEPTCHIEYLSSGGVGLWKRWPLDGDPSASGVAFWRRITPPQQPKPKSVDIKITAGRRLTEATPLPDGTIRLDCGDVITRESADKLFDLREEVLRQ